MYLRRYTWNACQYCTNLHISQCVLCIVIDNTFQNTFFSPLLCPTLYHRIGIKIRINTESELSGCFIRSGITSFSHLSTMISLFFTEQRGKGKTWWRNSSDVYTDTKVWVHVVYLGGNLGNDGGWGTGKVTQGREEATEGADEQGLQWWYLGLSPAGGPLRDCGTLFKLSQRRIRKRLFPSLIGLGLFSVRVPPPWHFGLPCKGAFSQELYLLLWPDKTLRWTYTAVWHRRPGACQWPMLRWPLKQSDGVWWGILSATVTISMTTNIYMTQLNSCLMTSYIWPHLILPPT